MINWGDWLNDICILRVMDIHCSYQNLLFWAGIVWHKLSANQIVRCFKLKNFKTIWCIEWIFCFHWSYKKYHTILVMLENTLGQSLCRIFYFWLVWLLTLLILIPGGPLLHCTCFVYDFSRKMFFWLYFINWPNFNVSLPLLLEMLDNMCITIVCFLGCNIIYFKINLIFLIKLFCWITKKSRGIFKYFESGKRF